MISSMQQICFLGGNREKRNFDCQTYQSDVLWWLRMTSYLNDHVTYTTSLGGVSVNGREVTRQDAGVRPVIWITVE